MNYYGVSDEDLKFKLRNCKNNYIKYKCNINKNSIKQIVNNNVK